MRHDIEGFRAAAEAYENSRPSYPPAAITYMTKQIGITASDVVLDVAAGTGKLTREIKRITRNIIAIDRCEEMLEQLHATDSTIPCVLAEVESLPFLSNYFRAVVVGQAFHWFNPIPALAEIHRVLQVNGGLCLVWNVRDLGTDWVASMENLVEPYRSDAPVWHDIDWKAVTAQQTGFSPLQRQDFSWVRDLTVGEALLNLASRSYIAGLPEDKRFKVLQQAEMLLNDYVENDVSSLALPFTTRVFWCFKVE